MLTARRTPSRARSLRHARPAGAQSASVGPGRLGSTSPGSVMAGSMVMVIATAVGVVSLTQAARADGGGMTSVTCHATACHLAAQSRRTTQPGGPPNPGGSTAASSGGGLGGLARHFANDAAACLPLGALAPACMAARMAAMFGGGAPPGGARPSPMVLARRAAARLGLPQPVMHASPGWSRLLVGLPTWLWLDDTSWKARSASASVPGVSVTARATPTRVVWATGDGSRVVCQGPGTPWRPGASAESSSPTCGYTYPRSSAGQPGGRFDVRATVTWSVRWSGAGQSGDLPGMSTSATAAARVAESQALNGNAAATAPGLAGQGLPALNLIVREVGRCGHGCAG